MGGEISYNMVTNSYKINPAKGAITLMKSMLRPLLCLTLVLSTALPVSAGMVPVVTTPVEAESPISPAETANSAPQAAEIAPETPAQTTEKPENTLEQVGETAENPPENTENTPVETDPNRVVVTVDGVASESCFARLEGWTSYVSFYYGAKAIRPDLEITWEEGVFVARAEDVFMTVSCGDRYLQINGRYLPVAGGIQEAEDGAAWLPIRVLATALGAQVNWTGQVELTAGGSPLTEDSRPYSAEDLDILARVIQHEAGYEPMDGRIAVGNVIMNRVASPSFPNTVSGVVYARNQFPGATNATPREGAILAAKLALEGINVVPGAYYFNGVGKPCWASRYKAHLYTIGGHAFYG